MIFLVVFQLLLAVSMTVLFVESTLTLATALIAFDRVSELRSSKLKVQSAVARTS